MPDDSRFLNATHLDPEVEQVLAFLDRLTPDKQLEFLSRLAQPTLNRVANIVAIRNARLHLPPIRVLVNVYHWRGCRTCGRMLDQGTGALPEVGWMIGLAGPAPGFCRCGCGRRLQVGHVPVFCADPVFGETYSTAERRMVTIEHHFAPLCDKYRVWGVQRVDEPYPGAGVLT